VYIPGTFTIAFGQSQSELFLPQGISIANTTQFPAISPSGSHKSIQAVLYGPKHKAIPSFIVIVGIRYNLNRESKVDFVHNQKNLSKAGQ
jgi:hypothetical protein